MTSKKIPVAVLGFLLPGLSHSATLTVDQRGGTSYATIAAAVAVVQPGDTILLAAGSGPYRENIKITRSGTAAQPIVFDGNGELVTGFDPFVFTYDAGTGNYEYTLPAAIPNTSGTATTPFRHLIVYQGQRLVVDYATGQLTSEYATLSADGLRLVLNPASGASPTSGWEIGADRTAGKGVVNIGSAYSYQTYRNLRVSGSQDDGFSLKGTGTNLLFQNVEAFHNFDEGFSAHSSTHSEIDGGVFWGNDNGVYNETTATVACILRDVQAYANLGYGIAMTGGTNEVHGVQCWDNGVQNLSLGGTVTCDSTTTYENRWDSRPWVSYNESQAYQVNRERAYAYYQASGTVLSGAAPTVLTADQLPPLLVPYDDWRYIYFTAAQVADPAISGPAADPDGDGASNQTEYEGGTDPTVADVTLPAVAVTVQDGYADETQPLGHNSGRFKIARAGSTAGALSVNFALSGVAVNGTDYVTVSSPAIIPDGAAYVWIYITPYYDGISEPSESVIMTLASGSTYTIDAAHTSASFSITNTP